jgi:hypothetical protein
MLMTCRARASGSARRAARTLFFSVGKARTALGLVRRGDAEVVVFDQGIATTLRELVSGASADDRRLQEVARAAIAGLGPARFFLVQFDVDTATAVKRIQARPGSLGPYDRMSPARAIARLREQELHAERVLESLESAPGVVGVMRLDARRPPSESASAVTDALLGLLSVPGGVHVAEEPAVLGKSHFDPASR